jgi:hypothetical protein
MTAQVAPLTSRADYSAFLARLADMLKTVLAPSTQESAHIQLTPLPGFDKPVESLMVGVRFAGALCLFNFGQSAVDPDLYFLDVELQRPQQSSLFLKDYVAHHRLHGPEQFRFRLSEHALEAGISKLLDTVRALLNVQLRPVLEGGAWVTAPVDWGDYK